MVSDAPLVWMPPPEPLLRLVVLLSTTVLVSAAGAPIVNRAAPIPGAVAAEGAIGDSERAALIADGAAVINR